MVNNNLLEKFFSTLNESQKDMFLRLIIELSKKG